MACLLCGSDVHEPLVVSTRMIRSSFAGTQVVRCRECGLDYLTPIPHQPPDLYEEGYWRAYQDAGMVFPTEAVLHPRYRRRLEAVQGRLGKAGRLLEIGIGHGGFMQLGARAGWDVTGVELSRYAAEQVQQRLGLPVIHGSIETAALPDGHYDMVHMSHVLEHLSDPLAALGRIRRLLRPGGVVAIEVPNELENLHVRLQRAIGRVRPYPVRSTHICFFTPASLRATLVRAGFDVTHLTTMRDETDQSPLRRTIKLAAGAVERRLDRGPLIEAFGVSGAADRRAE